MLSVLVLLLRRSPFYAFPQRRCDTGVGRGKVGVPCRTRRADLNEQHAQGRRVQLGDQIQRRRRWDVVTWPSLVEVECMEDVCGSRSFTCDWLRSKLHKPAALSRTSQLVSIVAMNVRVVQERRRKATRLTGNTVFHRPSTHAYQFIIVERFMPSSIVRVENATSVTKTNA